MYRHPPNANGIGCLKNPHASIANQGATKPSAMQGTINRQATQNDHWNGLRHVAAKLPRGMLGRDGTGGKCVVSKDPRSIADHESSGRTLNLIFQASAF